MVAIYLRDDDKKVILEIAGQVIECDDALEALEELRKYYNDLYD